MSLSQTLDKSCENWRNFLVQNSDIPKGLEWGEHVKYFREIVSRVISPEFDLEQLGTTMYRQPQAGFYRWNILDRVSQRNIFEAKFHVFPEKSRTYIHAHGYEGHSFVLGGALRTINFSPNRVSDEIEELMKIFSTDAFQQVGDLQSLGFSPMLSEGESFTDFVERNKLRLNSEGLQGLHKKHGAKNYESFVELKGKINENPRLIFEIHEELFLILTGQKSQYSDVVALLVHGVLGFDSVREFAQYLLHGNEVYKMYIKEDREIQRGETHSVGINEAHSVEVLEENTATLFLTRKPKTRVVTEVNEGEYLLFQDTEFPQRYLKDFETAREVIVSRLKEIVSYK